MLSIFYGDMPEAVYNPVIYCLYNGVKTLALRRNL